MTYNRRNVPGVETLTLIMPESFTSEKYIHRLDDNSCFEYSGVLRDLRLGVTPYEQNIPSAFAIYGTADFVRQIKFLGKDVPTTVWAALDKESKVSSPPNQLLATEYFNANLINKIISAATLSEGFRVDKDVLDDICKSLDDQVQKWLSEARYGPRN